VIAFARIVLLLLADLVGLALLSIRPRRSIEAENLVLRRQLSLYKERGVKPRRIDAATRVSLAWLARWCDWRSSLIVVRPETVIRWHRAGWRLLWRYKSRPGRPRIPLELRQLIRRIATGWVEDWRAGVGRGLDSLLLALSVASVPAFRPCLVSSPRRLERSVRFSSHYAHLFASCHGL
jgi:putative transposase